MYKDLVSNSGRGHQRPHFHHADDHVKQPARWRCDLHGHRRSLHSVRKLPYRAAAQWLHDDRTGRRDNRVQRCVNGRRDGNQHEWPERCRGAGTGHRAAVSRGRDLLHRHAARQSRRRDHHHKLHVRHSGESHFLANHPRSKCFRQERHHCRRVRRHMNPGKQQLAPVERDDWQRLRESQRRFRHRDHG